MKNNIFAISVMQILSIIILAFGFLAFPNIIFCTEIQGFTPKGPYPGTVTADLLDIPFTAGSITSTTFTASGNDLLIIHNPAGAVRYVTIDSVANEFGRQNDINNYQMGAGEFHGFLFNKKAGWVDSNNAVNVVCSTDVVRLAVARIPFMRNITASPGIGTVTPITPVGPYPTSVAANDLYMQLAFPQVAGASFPITGRELMIVHNSSGSTARTFTIESVADSQNRTGDISDYSLGAGEQAAFWFGNTVGWKNHSGCVEFTPSNTDLNMIVIKIPN